MKIKQVIFVKEKMQMIIADKRDYKKGYKKHFASYQRLRSDNCDINSRRLLLIYSVECGLKYMLLDKWHEENPKTILEGTDEKRKDIIKSHNLEKILKELGQQGNFKFPQIKTVHRDVVVTETYHQLYRYSIRTQEDERSKEEGLEETLKSIAVWIEEGM